jgi:hypothetical protein
MGLEGLGDRDCKIGGRATRGGAEVDDDILDHEGLLLALFISEFAAAA